MLRFETTAGRFDVEQFDVEAAETLHLPGLGARALRVVRAPGSGAVQWLCSRSGSLTR